MSTEAAEAALVEAVLDTAVKYGVLEAWGVRDWDGIPAFWLTPPPDNPMGMNGPVRSPVADGIALALGIALGMTPVVLAVQQVGQGREGA